MEIKPKFNTNTIKMATPSQAIKLDAKVVRDPSGEIPNGIYKVIRWEKIMLLANIIISSIILLGSIIVITLFATVLKTAWIAHVIPSIFLMASFYKFFSSYIENNRLNNEVKKYREDLKIGLNSQPPFLIRIYRNIVVKQIKHNWLSFFIIANGSIFVLLLWWLKDVSWWIFNFKDWIHSLFSNPDVMTILFACSLLFVAVIHIFMAIQRKRKLIEMDSFFGYNAIPAKDIDELKTRLNKAYRRLFIIYIMIMFLIPASIWIILKRVRKK